MRAGSASLCWYVALWGSSWHYWLRACDWSVTKYPALWVLISVWLHFSCNLKLFKSQKQQEEHFDCPWCTREFTNYKNTINLAKFKWWCLVWMKGNSPYCKKLKFMGMKWTFVYLLKHVVFSVCPAPVNSMESESCQQKRCKATWGLQAK